MNDIRSTIDKLYEKHLKKGAEAVMSAEGLIEDRARAVLSNKLLRNFERADADPDVNFHYGSLLDLDELRRKLDRGDIETREEFADAIETLLKQALDEGVYHLRQHSTLDEQAARTAFRRDELDEYPAAQNDPIVQYSRGVRQALTTVQSSLQME